MYETVIWATDGTAGADVALVEALRLAELSGGRVVAVHCDQRLTGRAIAWPTLADEDDRRLKIRRQVDQLQSAGIDVDVVIRKSHREAADVVAAVAGELDGDVIVCGTRGRGALSGAFLGSFTQRLLHVTPCAVLAVPDRKAVARESERERSKAGA